MKVDCTEDGSFVLRLDKGKEYFRVDTNQDERGKIFVGFAGSQRMIDGQHARELIEWLVANCY